MTPEGLSVHFMQQDKFEQAANCMEVEDACPSSSTPNQSLIESPDHRKGSTKYWKEKFMLSQTLIHELNEKSLRLEDIPGLLTIEKVKPKMSKETTLVTQVHESMHGKEILKLVKEIKEKKDLQKRTTGEKIKKKEEEKLLFLQCKSRCVCGEKKCLALGLKECPSCHSILRSICSKAGCRIDGKRPDMILPVAATHVAKSLFRGNNSKQNDDESDDYENDDSD